MKKQRAGGEPVDELYRSLVADLDANETMPELQRDQLKLRLREIFGDL